MGVEAGQSLVRFLIPTPRRCTVEFIVFAVVLFLLFVAFFGKSAPYAANPTTAPGGVAGSVAWSGCGLPADGSPRSDGSDGGAECLRHQQYHYQVELGASLSRHPARPHRRA